MKRDWVIDPPEAKKLSLIVSCSVISSRCGQVLLQAYQLPPTLLHTGTSPWSNASNVGKLCPWIS